jgi:hypothetical protein
MDTRGLWNASLRASTERDLAESLPAFGDCYVRIYFIMLVPFNEWKGMRYVSSITWLGRPHWIGFLLGGNRRFLLGSALPDGFKEMTFRLKINRTKSPQLNRGLFGYSGKRVVSAWLHTAGRIYDTIDPNTQSRPAKDSGAYVIVKSP